MKNSSIIRPIIKGILTPILTLSMCIGMVSPAFAVDYGSIYLPGEREALGEKNPYGAVPSNAVQADNLGRTASVAYGDGSGHLSEGFIRDSAKNQTKMATEACRLFQNVSWGWGTENKEVGEQQNHATINTYFKVKGDKPRKQYRAVYIMSTCTAHGFNWVSAASTISYLITKYEHVDVITCAFHTSDTFNDNSNQKRFVKGLINGSFYERSDTYRADRFRVRYDVQDIKCREWYRSNGATKSRELNITLKEMAEKPNGEGFFHPGSESFPEVLSNRGKRPEDFYIIKGMMSESGKHSSLMKLKSNGNVDNSSLFRVERGTDPGTYSHCFGGDRHSQGFELAALEAYLKGDLPGGKSHTIEAPVDTDGNGTVDKYENGISHLYMNVDGTGWMEGRVLGEGGLVVGLFDSLVVYRL